MPVSSIDRSGESHSSAALWARDALAAIPVALVGISFYLSSATLVFQGVLAAHLPAAIGAALLGGGVLALIVAWRGSLMYASGGPEPGAVPVIAAITVAAGSAAPAQAALPTAVMALAVTGVAIGAAWWLMGRRGWGELSRYVPYPVIGGFLGSVGSLLVIGGLSVATAQPYSLAHFAAWLGGAMRAGSATAADMRLLVAAGLGVILWWVTANVRHPLALPAALAGGALAIHGALAAAGFDLAAVRAAGWLPAPFADTLPRLPLSPALLAQVQWDIVAQQAALVLSAVIVATLSLLLSESSLEVAFDETPDIDQDLRTLGLGNVLVAAFGGMAGGLSISRSLMTRMAGAVSRRCGAIKGVLCLLVLTWGGPLIALVPRPLLGALLVSLGIAMLKTWLVDSRRRVSRAEHVLMLSMLGVTALVGFLPAVCVGVLACCVGFAAGSSRLSPVRMLVSRRAWPSKVERSAAQDEYLQQHGESLRVIELQGVLFFGSVTQLTRRVEAVAHATPRPQRLVFDFRHVRSLDTSAAQALARLFRSLRRQGLEVELSQLPAAMQRAMHAAGTLSGADAPRVHADIDAAVAVWDDETLARSGIAYTPFEQWLSRVVPADRLLPHFETVSLRAGEVLFRRGDASDALYVVRSGPHKPYPLPAAL